MKIRRAIVPLLFSAVAAAQSPIPAIAPPPIKMGLWQSSVTITSGGGMVPAGRPIANQSCYTPDSWKESMQSAQSHGQKMNCTTSNFQQDSHQISYDGECSPGQGMTMDVHVQMVLDSDSAMHGTTTTKMNGPMFPQGMTVSSAISSKFLSSDCGTLKPGESKPVHP
jgi:hypothetical protein